MNNFIQNFIGFDGRLNRQPFWLSAIALAVVSAIVSIIILPIIGLSVMPNMAQLAQTTPADMATMAADIMRKSAWGGLISFIIFVYPSAAICIKRRHDRNSSGMDVWIYLGLSALLLLLQALGVLGFTMNDIGNGVMMPMPSPIMTGITAILGIYGIYLLVVLGFLKGTAGDNQYGPDPLGGGAA